MAAACRELEVVERGMQDIIEEAITDIEHAQEFYIATKYPTMDRWFRMRTMLDSGTYSQRSTEGADQNFLNLEVFDISKRISPSLSSAPFGLRNKSRKKNNFIELGSRNMIYGCNCFFHVPQVPSYHGQIAQRCCRKYCPARANDVQSGYAWMNHFQRVLYPSKDIKAYEPKYLQLCASLASLFEWVCDAAYPPAYPYAGFVLNLNVCNKFHRDENDMVDFCGVLAIGPFHGRELCLSSPGPSMHSDEELDSQPRDSSLDRKLERYNENRDRDKDLVGQKRRSNARTEIVKRSTYFYENSSLSELLDAACAAIGPEAKYLNFKIIAKTLRTSCFSAKYSVPRRSPLKDMMLSTEDHFTMEETLKKAKPDVKLELIESLDNRANVTAPAAEREDNNGPELP
ncbi:hypothetical protein B0H16DRAFT_1462416 [Mycena metata]|uniref:Uncharacterized protein n=1 Tax=Mycena metata TaxID=1033252 RepID=A0AAD7IMM4_9AGAR|nr:hypothetical protein B0H16DRAFT_1462416 [Mycena metata]